MLIQLRQNGTELKDEATVVPSQVNRTFKNLTWRPIRRLVVTLKPVFDAYLGCFLGFRLLRLPTGCIIAFFRIVVVIIILLLGCVYVIVILCLSFPL